MPATDRRLGGRLAALAAAFAFGVALTRAGALPASGGETPGNAVSRLTSFLLGTYRGSSPGNDLTVVASRVGLASGPASQLARLEVRVTGKYSGDAVALRGLWRISYQGDVVWLVFIPGADPLDASRRFADPTFTPTELEAGCWTLLTWRDGAFEGTVKTAPNCRNALGAGAVQSIDRDWRVRFSQDQMRFENRDTGEVLTFARETGKPG